MTGTIADNGVGLLTVQTASLADVVPLGGASRVVPVPLATGRLERNGGVLGPGGRRP
ncbi:MAG TPA: hypothetical protein VL025_21945 [Thermoanaerobaculia bacterium]|nr:hypothetical protein [Thermoanaerobaculia bacterium]